jgi:hypothetical protein
MTRPLSRYSMAAIILYRLIAALILPNRSPGLSMGGPRMPFLKRRSTVT